MPSRRVPSRPRSTARDLLAAVRANPLSPETLRGVERAVRNRRRPGIGGSEAETSVQVASGGRITIPREVRERLGILPGDRLELRFRGDGSITLRRRPSGCLEDVVGVLRRPGQRAVSVEQMNETILSHHAEEAARQAGPRRTGRARPAVRKR
ncbi:AbrB/MazE/SpoVT family DNA-binding domain-containing protein [Acidobacteria bacterium ACD]|nr:MAG: AbrB/MazE/SpoVT family DNA-binding domain-containing protein [Acidobacteriota bacterium]MCE7957228.1 AbrB/MazE/SpoVT family DNA-binding domain-containing protein [Acidobacteria bacterium ACB2]MDL1949821.1 AbrB/MazE/SpoVT family DNA-binding domain-containing protein [Acidobacteria bacterium ACD]